MQGPTSSNNDKTNQDNKRSKTLRGAEWSHYADPQNIIPTLLLTSTVLLLVHFYRSYLRRIPEATNISSGFFRKRSLFGRVTSVGDGDNFRLFHTPGGRFAGWGWMPGRIVPKKRDKLKARTVPLSSSGCFGSKANLLPSRCTLGLLG